MVVSSLFLAVAFMALVSGEPVINNGTLIDSGEPVIYNGTTTDADTTEWYHNHTTVSPDASPVNVSLLFDHDVQPTKVSQGDAGTETSSNYPNDSNSSMPFQFNQTLLFNGTSEANATHEEDESFQEQEEFHPYWQCDYSVLEFYAKLYCVEPFHNLMNDLPSQLWCNWTEIQNPYNLLSECMEYVAEVLRCYYPNPMTEAIFEATHETFFRLCEPEEEDAPAGLVMGLTLLPVCLIPLLVSLVVWKNRGEATQ